MKMYFKNNRTALIFLLAMLVVAPIKAQVVFGDAAKFNDGWLFRLTDDSAIVRTDYDDSEWRKLSLPPGRYPVQLASVGDNCPSMDQSCGKESFRHSLSS